MFYRFESLQRVSANPHLSTGEGGIIAGTYMSIRVVHKKAGTGSELHYHPNELLIFVLEGALNALVGKDRRIATPGTFIHVPAFARHSMKATEAGPAAYIYVKDHTWSIVGVAVDEAPPDQALSIDEVQSAVKQGRWPGQAKEPTTSKAIVEGLNNSFHPIVNLDHPIANSAPTEFWAHGERIVFGHRDVGPDQVFTCSKTHEQFLYIHDGEMTTDLPDAPDRLTAGDVVHVPKGVAGHFTPAGHGVRYSVLQSTPFLQDRVDTES